jgi:hypothetical protein
MKILLIVFTTVFAFNAQAESLPVHFRIFSCTIAGSPNPDDVLHVYVTEKEAKRIEYEAGFTEFQKLVRNPSGEIIVRGQFGFMGPAREFLAPFKYEYNLDAQELTLNFDHESWVLKYEVPGKGNTHFNLVPKEHPDFIFTCAKMK